MSAQTTYDATPAAGFPGLQAESFSQRQVDSYLIETAAQKFGAAVVLGTDGAKQVTTLADGASNVFAGVVVASLALEVDGAASGSPTYPVAGMAPVMTRGRIWVLADEAITVGARVYPTVADSQKWGLTPLTNVDVAAFARTAAGADGDLLMIELVGPAQA